MSGNIYVTPTGLPKQYQAVEYIQTDGTAYISTNFYPTINSKIVIKASGFSEPTVSSNLFGCRASDSVDMFCLNTIGNKESIRIGFAQKYFQFRDDTLNGGENTSIPYTENSIFNIIVENNSTITINCDDVDYTVTNTGEITDFISENNLILFGYNNGGNISSANAQFKIYECYLYENNVLMHRYIPCYKKSNNEIGLYDIIDNIFYTNAGEGNFIKGNNIDFIIQKEKYPDYIPLELIKAPTERYINCPYINTNIIPNANTRVVIKGGYYLENEIFEGIIFGSEYGDYKTGNFYYYEVSVNKSGNKYNFMTREKDGSKRLFYSYDELENKTKIDFELDYDFPNKKVYIQVENSEKTECDISGLTLTISSNFAPLAILGYQYNTKNNDGSSSSGGTGTRNLILKSIQIYNSNNLILDFIPALRKEDQKSSIYEKISNIFYEPQYNSSQYEKVDFDYNELPEKFLYAQKVSKVYALVKKIPDEYQEVEYIQNDGNHYIDSEYQPNENTRIYGEFSNISSSTAIVENFFGVNETDKNYWTNFDNQELEPHLQSQIYNEDKVQEKIDFQDFLRPRKIIVEKELDKLKYTLTKTNDLSTETKFSLLPSQYQPVKYIESTGTQYIDLGFIPNQNTGFDIDFVANNSMATIESAAFFGSEQDNNTNSFKLGSYSSTAASGQFVFKATQTFTIGIQEWKRTFLKFRNKILTKPDGTTVTINQTFNCPVNLYLFALNRNGETLQFSKARIYSLKFYDGDTIIRDLYPCYDKQTGKRGLYDIINKTFYYNLNEGNDFLTNEDSILPQEYQQVEYIQSTGSQYIITPVDCQNLANTFIECNMGIDTNIYPTDYYLMGSYLNNTGKAFCYFVKGQDDSTNKGKLRVRIGNKTSDPVTAANFNTDIHHFSMDGKQKRLVYNQTFTNLSSVTLTNFENKIYFFSFEYDNTRVLKAKLYRAKIIVDTEVYDYYPCYRKSDGVAGVYDIIHNQFLTNANTEGDDFVIGPKVNADGSLIVPNNYLKLDYLESDGNQYIDTLVSNTTGLRIEGDIELLNSGEKQGIIGSDTDTNGISILINSERNLLAKLGAGAATISTNYLYKNSRFNFNLDEKNIKVSINNVTTAKTSSAAYSQITDEIPNIKLFGNSYHPNGECRIYSVKITEDDIITHYYIPCINIQTNIAGMYDIITNTFLTNSGTGEFITKYNNYYYELETNPYIFENYNSLYISAINDINEERVWSSNLKIYRFKIYEKDKLIKDFVPVKRKSDNLLGLFDICNQSFHPFETNEEILDNTQSGNEIENNDNTAHVITKVYTSVNNIAKQVHQKTYIPSQYQQVEYVGCSANAVVDLGFIPTLHTGFDIDFNQSKTVTTNGYGTVFGTRKAAKVNAYLFSSYNGGLIEIGNVETWRLGMLRNTRQNFSFRNLSIRNYNANGFTKLLTNTFFSPPGNLTLFSLKNNTATSQIHNGFVNIFSLKFYNGYKKQNDYYPCYRKSDNVIGFYDRISKQFITQTAGTLIKGNNFVKRL